MTEERRCGDGVETVNDEMNYKRYVALNFLVAYGNLYHLLTIEYPAKVAEVTDVWRAQAAPGSEHRYISTVRDEHVRWMLEMGYARVAEHDPLFARAKVVPTPEGRLRLQQHGLTAESEGVGVHIGHCCEKHGCKYADEFCPVASGMFKQDHPCESCSWSQERENEVLDEMSDEDLVDELVSRGYTVTKGADDVDG